MRQPPPVKHGPRSASEPITLELAKVTEKGEAWAIRLVKGVLPLGGGVQILKGDGSLVGAVGVSGAPSGANDEKCARAGIAVIEDEIAF